MFNEKLHVKAHFSDIARGRSAPALSLVRKFRLRCRMAVSSSERELKLTVSHLRYSVEAVETVLRYFTKYVY